MKFDLIVVGILTLFGLLGLLFGAVRQVSQWAGLAAAYLGARPTAMALTPWAVKRLPWPPIIVSSLLCGIFFLIFTAVVSASVRLFLMKGMNNPRLAKADKAFGFILGAANAAAIVFVVLSLALYIENPRSKSAKKFAAAAPGSRTVAFVRDHNLFSKWNFASADSLKKLLAGQNPSEAQVMADNPELKTLMSDPRIREILNDPAFAARLRRLQEDPGSGDGSH
jgi:uncharacterized membrane protein required for colicin V production